MRVVERDEDGVLVELTLHELAMAHQAMNEVANGFRISDEEVARRVGASRSEVRRLLDKTHPALRQMRLGARGCE